MSKWIWICGTGVAVAALAGGAALWHLRQRRAPGPVARTDSSFQFTARAPLRTAFPLFGAWGERAWGGESWQPRFLYPDPPRDEAGEVFTVAHGHGHEAVWVNTAFDLAQGKIQYVYVLPGVQAVLIDLALEEAGGGRETLVRVRYRRTALSVEMNERVQRLGREDASSPAEWSEAVNAALAAPAAAP